MTWVKIDDLFPEHPKVVNVGPLAKALFVDALCYASRHLTDGVLSRQIVRRLAREYSDYADPEDLLNALVDGGLLDEDADGLRVHGYLDHQRSAEQIRNERDAARERMANSRKRSGEVRANTSGSSTEVQQPETERELETELIGATAPKTPSTTPKKAPTPIKRPPVQPVEPSGADPYALFSAVCEEQGQDASVVSRSQLGRQLSVAKRLIDSGLAELDVRAMTQWLQSQSWVTGGIDMFLLEKQLAKWQMSGKPTVAVTPIRPGSQDATFDMFRDAIAEFSGDEMSPKTRPKANPPRQYSNIVDTHGRVRT